MSNLALPKLEQHLRRYVEEMPYDKAILRILEELGISVPVNFLSSLSGLKKDRVSRICTQLEKYGRIKKTTTKPVVYIRVLKA
ncbi:MAG: hypothetical protein V1678_02900 [Candidatus Aenigmatarchaeota archaeon]